MSISERIKRTSSESPVYAKFCVYGQSGTGKTTLSATLPTPFVISAEGGLLSLRGADIPYIDIKTIDELREAFSFLASPDAAHIESVVIDSISEIAEIVLATEKARMVNGKPVDPRQAYGATQEAIVSMIRAFSSLPKHLLVIAKCEKTQDEAGRLLYQPAMVGQKLGQQLPYMFDFLFALRNEKDTEGNVVRYLQTHTDGLWQAKERGGYVDAVEMPDLGAIIKKLGV